MSSFELKPLIPRASMLYKVSITPSIIFRLDTTPEFCTRGTRHFLRNAREASVRASRSAPRANRTTWRRSACRAQRVHADRSQNHALATRNKQKVAMGVHAAVQAAPISPRRCPWHPKKGGPFRLTVIASAAVHVAACRIECRLSTLRTHSARAKAVRSGCVSGIGRERARTAWLGHATQCRAKLARGRGNETEETPTPGWPRSRALARRRRAKGEERAC